MNDSLALTIIFGSLMGFFILLVGAAVGGDYLYHKDVECPHFGASVERPVRFDYFGGGCFVQDTRGQWVQMNNYWNNTLAQ